MASMPLAQQKRLVALELPATLNGIACTLKFKLHPRAESLMVSAEPNAKNQHYIWQHYLNAWAVDGTFCCYRQKDKKLFSTQPKAVASESYFYEAQQLTAGDIKFLEDFTSRATDERHRELNRDYVKITQLTFELRERLKSTDLLPEVCGDLEEKLRWAERNLGERYHAGIENKCQDILDSLRSGDDLFYKDEMRCADFLYFLALQYFRTAKMREGLSNIPSYVPGHDPRRTAKILNHIFATTSALGCSGKGTPIKSYSSRTTRRFPSSRGTSRS